MSHRAALELARYVDISCVRAQHDASDVRQLAAEAMRWHCINAHVLPSWLPLLRELIDGSDTLVAAPAGFPSGGATTEVKVFETERLVDAGVQELDVIINIGRLIDGDEKYVLDELQRIVSVVPSKIPVKVIIEVSALSESQIRIATRLVAESGASFVKSGTGWAGPVTVTAVKTIAKELKACNSEHVQIKAAGGIRTPLDIVQLQAAGATRFGIGLAAAVSILEAVDQA